MVVENITLREKQKIATLRRTAWGYEVQTLTRDGRTIYLRSVYKNSPKYYVDYTHAGHFSYKTAMKHAENILKGKYTKGV